MFRLFKRLTLALLMMVLLLGAPIAWVEMSCRGPVRLQGERDPDSGTRPESKTFTTYPEWHIVHAYEDYAHVISSKDPHHFNYLSAIGGFWGSLCPLAQMADAHGGFTSDSRATIYTIGVSFTMEMMMKAAYEETIGRLFTWIRGAERAPLDDLSAEQAMRYAEFLRMTPWYKWNFVSDAEVLSAASSGSARDTERRLALGGEYNAKALYARLIAKAVAATGNDQTRMVVEVAGLDPQELAGLPGVKVISTDYGVTTAETPRYREFTELAREISSRGGRFVTIAGNRVILLSAISRSPDPPQSLFSFLRQGRGDWRVLFLVPVSRLTERMSELAEDGIELEHIHDY